jgi:hypothetical protein
LFLVSEAGSVQTPDTDVATTLAPVLFFVHVPKCAGSSFRAVLRRWYGPDAVFFDSNSHDELRRRLEGRTTRAVAGHFVFGLHRALACRPLYLGLVRDPVERFVSFYRHLRDVRTHALHKSAASMSLEAFYDHCLTDPRLRRQTLAIQCHFLAGERTFDAARRTLDEDYAVLAPVERYAEFVAASAVLAGQSPPPALVMHNVGERSEALDAARERIAARIREDHIEDERLYRHVLQRFEAGATGADRAAG